MLIGEFLVMISLSDNEVIQLLNVVNVVSNNIQLTPEQYQVYVNLYNSLSPETQKQYGDLLLDVMDDDDTIGE